ncbi:unnamed protein product [Arctogadus glacialis]
MPKEVGPGMLQRASGICRHLMRGGRSGKRSGWTVDTGSLERRPYLQDAIDARLHEDQRAMQQMAQVAAFNTAFLQTFNQMLQAFGHRDPVP